MEDPSYPAGREHNTHRILFETIFRFILSAAHCFSVSDERVQVVVGDYDRWRLDSGEERLQGTAIRPAQYSGVTRRWDVALIRLDRDIIFSSYAGKVAPVCLARSGLYNNNQAVVTGWGVTEEGGQKVYYAESYLKSSYNRLWS